MEIKKDKSNNFEKQIWRIKELISDSGVKVTWNKKIKDPDNLK